MPHDAGIRIHAAPDFICQSHVMVMVDGFRRGNARKHTLAAAAESGIDVRGQSARQNHLVGRRSPLVNPHGRAPFRRAVVDAGLLRRVVVVDFEPAVQVLAQDFLLFRRRVEAVLARGDDDAHIVIGHADPVQFRHQEQHELVEHGPCARNVAYDEDHLFAGPDDFVISRNGKCLSESSRYRLWKAIYKRMDILAGAVVYRNEIVEHAIAQDLDLYDLRHTYCTNLQSSGVALNVAKELMGHEDVTVTANIYTHTVSDNLHDAIGSLGAFMADEAAKQETEEKKRSADRPAESEEERKARGRAAKLRSQLRVISA